MGLVFAYWGLETLLKFSPAHLPRLQETHLDFRVLLFTSCTVFATGLLFGLAPAFQALKINLQQSLKEGGRSSASGEQHRLREFVIVSQLALAMTLLIGAGLLVRSFARLLAVDPGFKPESVLALDLKLPDAKYDAPAKRQLFFGGLRTRLESLAGVRAIGAVSILPLGGGAENLGDLSIEGAPAPRPGQEPHTDQRQIAGNYFQALGVGLLKGRFFSEPEELAETPVVIVNDTIARKFFPDQDPLGKRLTLGDGVWREIVGVVRDVKSASLDAVPRPQVYMPGIPNFFGGMAVAIRANGDPLSLATAIRNKLKEVDPEQPILNLRTMEQVVTESVAGRRFNMLLVALFAVVALVLTVIGLYGVVSYWVSVRTQEIGLRMALGAQKADVLRLVVGRGMGLLMVGLCVGIAGALGLTRLMASLLYKVNPTDPLTFAGVALLLTAVSLLACVVPARQAMRVDPMEALRYE